MNKNLEQMLSLVSLSQTMVDPFDKFFVGAIHIIAMIVGIAILRSIVWTVLLLALALMISAIIVIGRMYYKVKKGIRNMNHYSELVDTVFSQNVIDEIYDEKEK